MHDFHGLKTMTFQRLADIAHFWPAVTEIIQFFHSLQHLRNILEHSWELEKSKIGTILKFFVLNTAWFKSCTILDSIEIGWLTLFNSFVNHSNFKATCSVTIKKTGKQVHLGPVYTGPDKFGTDPRLGPDRPCVHTGPPGTGTMWVHLRKGPSTDLDRSRSRVNRQDWSHFGSVSLFTLSNRSVHAVAGSYSSLISA